MRIVIAFALTFGFGSALAQPVLKEPSHRAVQAGGTSQTARFHLDSDAQVTTARLLTVHSAVLSQGADGASLAIEGAGFAVALTEDQGVQALAVTIDPSAVPAAKYDLRVVLVTASADGPQPSEVRLQLSVLAPVLRAPAKIVLHRTVNLFGTEEQATPLLVRETSGWAPARALSIGQVGALTNEATGSVPGAVQVTSPAEVPSGGQHAVPWTVAGDVPLGLATGTLQIEAQGLDAPVEVQVEVRTRVASVWIIAIAVLGTLLGFFTRKVLVKYREKQTALAQARAATARIESELSRAHDGDYRDALSSARRALLEAVKSTDPQAIADAVLVADEARAGARSAHQERQRVAAERLREKQAALVGRPIPDGVAEPVQAQLEAVAGALRQGRVGAAIHALDALEGAGLAPVRQGWTAWRLEALQALDGVIRLGDLAGDADLGPAREAVSAFSPTAGDWAGLFEGGAEAASALHTAASDLWLVVDRETRALLAALPTGAGSAAAVARPITAALDAARDALSQDLADGAVGALGVLCDGLPERVASALRARSERDDVIAMIEARRFQAAAHGEPEYEPESSVAGVERRAQSGVVVRPAPSPRPPRPAGWQRWVSVPADPEQEAVELLARPGTVTRWLAQGALATANAVTISLIAYLLFADVFVGTGKDVATVLLWAYGVDFGAAGITDKVRDLKIGEPEA